MNIKHLIPIATAVVLLPACHDKKPQAQHQSATQLIEAVGHFQVDTVEAQPQDTLYGEETSSLLRHYPELYHAARKVRKTYEKWAEQARLTGLNEPTELLDISNILEETLSGSGDAVASTWPDLSGTDSLYLQLLANAPDNDRKSDIGRSRRAWLNYTGQLQQLMQTLPESLRQRYAFIVSRQTQAYQEKMQQQNQAKQT